MLNPEQLKDLGIYNGFRAMQLDLQLVQAQQQNARLAEMLEKANHELQRLYAVPAPAPAEAMEPVAAPPAPEEPPPEEPPKSLEHGPWPTP